jgi:hypothetical protein
MSERSKPDLRTIEPIGPAPDDDVEMTDRREADRVGRVSSAVTGAPPAVGVEADADRRERGEPRTSPETEEQLEQLRRA